MRLIPLKEINLGDDERPALADAVFRYADVIPMVLSAPDTNQAGQPTGFTFEQIERGLAVKAALKAAEDAKSDTLKLEEPEYAHLVACMPKMRWTIHHPAILTFRDDVMKAEKQDANAT